MKQLTLGLILLMIQTIAMAQSRSREGWVDFGGSHSAKWLQIAPAKLGPNALPVPYLDYARVGSESSVSTGAHYHYMPGDTTLNSYFSFYWNISPGRAAVKIWGNPSETFRLSDQLRNDRQIYYDDKGWTTQVGDLFISTYIQILREKAWLPSMVLSYTLKTTTGSNDHGRYTDAPLDYFYLSFGKSFYFNHSILDEIRFAGLMGFYVWQTNKVEMAQDEGPVYVGGIELRRKSFRFFAEIGGYTGYDAYEYLDRISGRDDIQGYNDPIIYRFRAEKKWKKLSLSTEYQGGLRDYRYHSFKVNFCYSFSPVSFMPN